MKRATVVAQFKYAAVKRATDGEEWTSFDVWKWNVFKLKWVRMINTACGYSTLANASITAREVSDEIEDMLRNNQKPPEALT